VTKLILKLTNVIVLALKRSGNKKLYQYPGVYGDRIPILSLLLFPEVLVQMHTQINGF
jgi:hypothetical protein